MTQLDTPLVNDEKQPVLALTLHCVDTQLAILEKLTEAHEYIRGLTEKEFEGIHRTNGIVIKIVDLKPE